MRVLFFADGEWGAKTLAKVYKSGYEIAGVVVRYKSRDGLVEDWTKNNNLPLFKFKKINSEEAYTKLKALSPDVIVSIAYDQILKRRLLDLAKTIAFNVHAGDLPKYRGNNPINWAIINGEEKIGITAHVMSEEIDLGPIIEKIYVPVTLEDNYATVLKKVVASIPDLVLDVLSQIRNKTIKLRHINREEGFYMPRRGEKDEIIKWFDTSKNIYNLIRAITRPAPGAYTYLGKQKLRVWSAKLIESPKFIANPGQVMEVLKEGVIVKTGDTQILLNEVQFEGESNSFIPHFPVGTRLGLPYSDLEDYWPFLSSNKPE
ncbi:methionyl-tRNA formyltransferase [Neomoorella thermoacetica]|uniref:methionyl-tRNA formyltransferase n=1 Tax=Neomoorella thermoacetica TaxID=1525 RepID=UPI0008FA032F|nr:methionyl-tRNA formyltransferase [Moorella thermoacetica]OIQ12542.1 bifunctional polymyxin resistance protein ArnA [Moorella thermoacetica]